MKLHKKTLIFELKIWRVNYFFCRPPGRKFFCFRIYEDYHSPTQPLIQLKQSFTRLKITFRETAQEYFLSSKFDNVSSTFFVDHLDKKLALFHNLLGRIIKLLGRPSFRLKNVLH